MNGTCQLKWLVSITFNSYYLKVQKEIEACRLSSQFSWQRKWIKLLHIRGHNSIPTVCYVTFHFYWEPPPPRPLPRYPPKFTLSVFHTTYFYASFERGYVFFFTFSRLDFSLTENIVLLREPLDLNLRLAPITWFAIWLAPIVHACPLWLADLSSRLYRWHLFYAFSSWREKECRWKLLPNIRMFRWAIQ